METLFHGNGRAARVQAGSLATRGLSITASADFQDRGLRWEWFGFRTAELPGRARTGGLRADYQFRRENSSENKMMRQQWSGF